MGSDGPNFAYLSVQGPSKERLQRFLSEASIFLDKITGETISKA